jgi:hypothetical protein
VVFKTSQGNLEQKDSVSYKEKKKAIAIIEKDSDGANPSENNWLETRSSSSS